MYYSMTNLKNKCFNNYIDTILDLRLLKRTINKYLNSTKFGFK